MSDSSSRPEDCPTAWFAVLERARIDHDYERAAAATRELRRLGVEVKFHKVAEATTA